MTVNQQVIPSLRITEIFHSIQGESNSVGFPTVFIRLTGCPLRCQYCDTAYAFHGGQKMSVSDILAQIKIFNAHYITVTGGEPLAQPACTLLLSKLCDENYQVSLETSGAMDISFVDKRVMVVMDLKTLDSNEEHKNLYENIAYLKKTDQIKFVICSRKDYEWSREKVLSGHLNEVCTVLFSPSYHQLAPKLLAEWILADKLPVRLQVQLHKYIWGDIPGV